ncbi:MAG: trypsin-like peptidase domain-containing protein [Candidatus Saccharimonadales bacterium]
MNNLDPITTPARHNVPAQDSQIHHQKKAKRLKLIIMVAITCSLVLAVILGIMLLQQTNSNTPPADNNEAVQLLETATEDKSRTITSDLGFALTYDTKSLDAHGQVTDPSSSGTMISGEEFSSKELDQKRAYSIVKLRLKEDENAKKVILAPQLTVLTNIRKNHLQKEMAEPANRGKSKLDVYIATVTASTLKHSPNTTASQPQDITIGDITYKKVTYTTTNNSYGITSQHKDDYYFTVQNDRAYYANISNIGAATDDQVRLLESVVKSLTFASPDQSKLSQKSGITLAATELPRGTANTVAKLKDNTLISVIAKNQPAVVRIGTIYCINANLLLPDGSVGLKIENACTGGIGSGSFVSSDGYIATNGHVVLANITDALSGYVVTPLIDQKDDIMLKRFKEMIQYFVASGLITKDQAATFISDLQASDSEALQKLSSLGSFIPAGAVKVTSDSYAYAVQTSNQPMRMKIRDNGEAHFDYNKTILPATYIASDFDPKSQTTYGYDPSSPNSDVAILKAKGSFPIVSLGTVDNLTVGAHLTAIGFPAFVDGGLTTTRKTTVPSITQGSISQIGRQSLGNKHTLILTNVPIAPGNSGGPAFSTDGKQIGLNTYAQLKCQDHQCFGSGIARDIADFKDLLGKENISLNTQSVLSDTWHEGLDLYTAAQYKQAAEKLSTAANQYPASYLMSSFADLAQSKIGSAEDKSPSETNNLLFIVAGAFSFFVIVSIVATVLLVKHNKKGPQSPPNPGQPASAAPAQAAATPYQNPYQQQPTPQQPTYPPQQPTQQP